MNRKLVPILLVAGLFGPHFSQAQTTKTSPHPMRPADAPVSTPTDTSGPSTSDTKGAVVRDGERGSLQDRRRKNPAVLKKTPDPMSREAGPDPEHGTDGSLARPTKPASSH